MRPTTTRTYLSMCDALLRELRNSPDLKLSDRILMMQRLSQTYKTLKELHQSGAALEQLGKQIKQIKQDLENKQNKPLEIVSGNPDLEVINE